MSSLATFSTHPSSPTHYTASQTALLLLDFHSLFLQLFPIAESAARRATDLKAWAQNQGITIVHCLIDQKLPIPPQAKDPERTKGFVEKLEADPAEAGEPEYLRPAEASTNEATFLRAPGYVSAQKSPNLTSWLREKGIKSLILAGISTSGCVLRTAVVASDDDFVVTVVEDGCADPGEGVHEMMCKHVLPMRAHVCGFEELKREWEGKRKAES